MSTMTDERLVEIREWLAGPQGPETGGTRNKVFELLAEVDGLRAENERLKLIVFAYRQLERKGKP